VATDDGAGAGGTVAAGRTGVFDAIWCSRKGAWALPAVVVEPASAPELGTSWTARPGTKANASKHVATAAVQTATGAMANRARITSMLQIRRALIDFVDECLA
jgi:hypothetical protein